MKNKKIKLATIIISLLLLSNISNISHAENLPARYDLREILPENLNVESQGKTDLCWAFSMLSNLQTNLALQDRKNGNTRKVYNFSEKHMAYATSRNAFLNGVINEKGFDRTAESLGNQYLSIAYLSNGMGAVSEESMPFDSSMSNIDINEINNKQVITTLVDATRYDEPSTYQEKIELMNKIKQDVINNGGVCAMIYGADTLNECYNNETGALYVDDSSKYPVNHSGLIVGWDDNYNKDNFREEKRPQNNGAWIVKNTWGEKILISDIDPNITNVQSAKHLIYINNTEQLNSYGYNSPQEITEEMIIAYFEGVFGKGKVLIQADSIYIIIGDNGFNYISYEDANILSGLWTIEKAKNYKDYENIYQYDYLGANNYVAWNVQSSYDTVYMANVFNINEKNQEITKIGVSTLVPMKNCKVLINPNGSSKNNGAFIQAKLQEGEYENLTAGYHTIELAEPIKINADSFVVVVEMTYENGIANMPVLMNLSPYWTYVQTQRGRSFYTTKEGMHNGVWNDFADIGNQNTILPIKVFTNTTTKANNTYNNIFPSYTNIEYNEQVKNEITTNEQVGNTKRVSSKPVFENINEQLNNDENLQIEMIVVCGGLAIIFIVVGGVLIFRIRNK